MLVEELNNVSGPPESYLFESIKENDEERDAVDKKFFCKVWFVSLYKWTYFVEVSLSLVPSLPYPKIPKYIINFHRKVLTIT